MNEIDYTPVEDQPRAGERERYMSLPMSAQMARRQRELFQALQTTTFLRLNHSARSMLMAIALDCGRWAGEVDLLEGCVATIPERGPAVPWWRRLLARVPA